MKDKIKLIGSIILYLFAIFILGYYLYIEFMPNRFFDIDGRIKYLCFICLLIYFGSLLLSKYLKNNKPMKIGVWLYFSLYLVLLITLVVFDYFRGGEISFILGNTSNHALTNYLKNSVNLVPFTTILGYFKAFFSNSMNYDIFLYNIFGNIICLMPFAFFLPRLFKKQNKFKVFLITILLINLGIEILQLLTLSGSFDVDDIILNTIGACIAFWLLNIKCLKDFLNNIFILEKNKFDKKDIIKLISIISLGLVIFIIVFLIIHNLNSNYYGYSLSFVDESNSQYCKDKLEKFYENNDYIYYFKCVNQGDHVYVIFKSADGEEKYLLKDFLNSNNTEYSIDDYTLLNSDLNIKIEAKKTELVIFSKVDGRYEYKVDNENICILEPKMVATNADNSNEYRFFINAKQKGRTILTFNIYDWDTNEKIFSKQYEIIVDDKLNSTYKELN